MKDKLKDILWRAVNAVELIAVIFISATVGIKEAFILALPVYCVTDIILVLIREKYETSYPTLSQIGTGLLVVIGCIAGVAFTLLTIPAMAVSHALYPSLGWISLVIAFLVDKGIAFICKKIAEGENND